MNYSKLRGKIIEVFETYDKFADAMGKDRSTISQKLNGHIAWSKADIIKACKLLDIPIEEVHLYFFTK